MNFREWAAMLPMLVLMVWMGTATQTFLPPISAANARILRQTQQNVDFHVERRTPAPWGAGKEILAADKRR
jgi:NADH-quinone oxidoreductase subunit M